MGRIPEATLEAIRDRIDLVELIGRHVNLRKAGSSYKGLCPFHLEKTPSFTVNQERGIYYCFGCNASGNAFSFLVNHDNLTFREAVRALASQCGMELRLDDDGPVGVIEAVEAVNSCAQEYYSKSLEGGEGKSARLYLKTRGLEGMDLKDFELGFAPERWDGLVSELRRLNIPVENGEKAGLIKVRKSGGHYDLLRGRLTFPIRDARGRIIAFGGRALDPGQEPKYLNTPESPIFRKREVLYGFPDALEAIRRSGRVLVVEGYFDRIALKRAGMAEGVATCGTALSEGHARNIRRRTRDVTLLFDGDTAGQGAAKRALEVLLPQGLRVRVVALPDGLDPDDVIRQEGAEALGALVEAASPAVDFVIACAVSAGCATPWQQADAVAEVAPILALLPNAVERGSYARRLALATGVEPREVETIVRQIGLGKNPQEVKPVSHRRIETPRDRHWADLLRLVLHSPSLGRIAPTRFADCGLESEWVTLFESAAMLADDDDVTQVSERLAHQDRDLFMRFVADGDPFPETLKQNEQIFEDILRWLCRDRDRSLALATTDRLRHSESDPTELLLEKQRQLDARRARAQTTPIPRPPSPQ